MSLKHYKRRLVNPNPRIGILLTHGRASVRLCNVFYRSYDYGPLMSKPNFRMRGLKWLRKHWPEERLRRECLGYGPACSKEWNNILWRRERRAPRGIRLDL